MKFREFYMSLKAPDREEFARLAGTTTRYIEAKLLCRNPAKRPEVGYKRMAGFEKASDGELSYEGIVSYFYLERHKAA